jgi:hypothetical protein
MQSQDGLRASAAEASPNPGARPRWDNSALNSHRASLATAAATKDEVVLSFGAKTGSDAADEEVTAELLRRIAINPVTAKNLRNLLSRLITEYDQAQRTR